jgi:hypothetical protein
MIRIQHYTSVLTLKTQVLNVSYRIPVDYLRCYSTLRSIVEESTLKRMYS